MDPTLVLGLLLGLALGDTPKADPNTLEPLAAHPRLMLKHSWKFTAPTINPALPRGAANPIEYRTSKKPWPQHYAAFKLPPFCTRSNPQGRFDYFWTKRPDCTWTDGPLMTSDWSSCTNEYVI